MSRSAYFSGLIFGAFIALGLSACGGGGAPSDEDTPSPTSTVQFVRVDDNTESTDYSIGSPAVGTIDQFGSTITLPLIVENANGTDIYLTATVTYASGQKVVCHDDDPRHQTGLNNWTDSVELPCPSGLDPQDDNALVTVTEG